MSVLLNVLPSQAVTTYFSTTLLWSQIWRPAFRAALPPLVRASVHAAFAMVNVQVLLGISTLLYLVPIPLAAAHQAGSVALLSAMVHLLLVLRGPGAAARALRAAKSMQRSPASTRPPSQRATMLHTMASTHKVRSNVLGTHTTVDPNSTHYNQ